MKKEMTPPKTVDEYIKEFSPKVRSILEKFRQTIKAAAPEAEEVISYQIPSYKFNGMLVSFAAWKNHIGFYPGAGAIRTFIKELSLYKGAKGSVQFPMDKPIPVGLISKIVKFRVKQNLERAKAKKIIK